MRLTLSSHSHLHCDVFTLLRAEKDVSSGSSGSTRDDSQHAGHATSARSCTRLHQPFYLSPGDAGRFGQHVHHNDNRCRSSHVHQAVCCKAVSNGGLYVIFKLSKRRLTGLIDLIISSWVHATSLRLYVTADATLSSLPTQLAIRLFVTY